ncbi:MAG: class I SAM-dependent methyltransferase [Thermoplasmatota archaeon]
MKDVERAANTFDSIAGHFDKTRNRPWEPVVEFIEKIGDDDGTLLDLGCGNGRHTGVAVDRGLDAIGLDASRSLLNISKKKIPVAQFLRGDIKKLPFSDNAFNHVIYIAAIHHLSEGRVESLREAKRVLKPGGSVLVSAWARELDRWDLEEGEADVTVPWHRDDGVVIERYYHLYRLDELKNDVSKSGLKVIDAFREGGNNYVEAINK